ncbi:MAG: 16S rRNA (uracil(1498)-N(3))-methyltransferase [Candidimonas sp.]
MSLPRFFCATALAVGDAIALPDGPAHHALRVLRLSPGSEIVLFNGQGGEYRARLLPEGKNVTITHFDPVERELSLDITLAQGIPSGDKMDWVIEKAVELGARRLTPIDAQRSIVQLRGDRLAKRMQHWRRVAQSASEQCGRNRLMRVDEPMTLDACVTRCSQENRTILFCDPDAPSRLAQAVAGARQAVTLLVGPEGGWSPQEQDIIQKRELIALRFGNRILRTETAGLALIAAVSALKTEG